MADQLDSAERDEGRLKRAAFITLFGLMSGHALLETARDALFLTEVSADRLPWAYLLIALAAVFVARIQAQTGAAAGHRQQLMILQGLAAVITMGFWALLPTDDLWLYYALYVWSGVIGSILIVTFWLVLGELFTIVQGKRIYAAIGTGGSAGAIVGYGLATLVTSLFPAEFLLPAASTAFAGSAIGPWLSLRLQLEEPTGESEIAPTLKSAREDTGLISSLRELGDHPYARRVALLVVLSAITITLGDYLFKSVLAEQVDADAIAQSLAQIYFALNCGSLLVLMFGVTRLIRRLSIHRALTILPGLICLAAVGILAGGALLPVVFLKLADGTLRYSLQKTASEVLYLPMPSGLRAKVKSTIDIVGQRGANAVASLLILIALWLGPSTLIIAGAMLLFAVAWVAVALELRGPYLDVFREALSEGTIKIRVDFPELDEANSETLIRALNHPDEQHVLAALDLLEAKDHAESIPSLILYHPSSAVVARALDIISSSGRRDFTMYAERLLGNEDPAVRGAMVRAMWAVEPDRDALEALLESDCVCTQASAAIGLRVNQWIDAEVAKGFIEQAVHFSDPEARLSVANAFKLHHLPEFDEPMGLLARDSDREVRLETLKAIRASNHDGYTPLLVQLLDDREIREEVRQALRERGDQALDQLEAALASSDTSLALLRHIPRSISRFESRQAAEVLLRALDAATPTGTGESGEPQNQLSGMVRFKILRGLVPLLEKSAIGDEIDKNSLRTQLARTLSRSIQVLHWRVWLEAGRNADATRDTCGFNLLLNLLEDKERLALQRVFRMLYLIQPKESFRQIWRGLRSMSRLDRASSLELLEHILEPDQRKAVVALAEPGSNRERLERTGSDLTNISLDYSEMLAQMSRDESRTLNCLAIYHATELGLELQFDEQVFASQADSARLSVRERALALMERMPEFRPEPGSVLGKSLAADA